MVPGNTISQTPALKSYSTLFATCQGSVLKRKIFALNPLQKEMKRLKERVNLNLTQSNIEELTPELKTLKSTYFEAIQEKIKTNWKYEEAKR